MDKRIIEMFISEDITLKEMLDFPSTWVTDISKMRKNKLPKRFKKYGRNIDNLPPDVQDEYWQWIWDNWASDKSKQRWASQNR